MKQALGLRQHFGHIIEDVTMNQKTGSLSSNKLNNFKEEKMHVCTTRS